MKQVLEPTALADRRKAYLALSKRRIRPGSGSSQAHLRSRTARLPVPKLSDIFVDTPYVVVGGLATRLYMPERMTIDADILVLVGDTEVCEHELTQAGCKKLNALIIGGVQWELPDGTTLDVILSDETWAYEAVTHPTQGPTGLPTIALPYLVVMKLFSGRAQDIADITRMLGGADDEVLQQVRESVATFMPDAVEDVESMIRLGQLEYK